MNTFTFSITDNIRTAWATFRRHAWLFLGLSIVMGILNIPDPTHGERHLLLTIAVAIVSIVFSYMMLSIFLAAVDGKDSLVQFGALRQHMPNFRQFLMLVEVAVLAGLCVIGGVILLVIPGIYVFVRLSLAQLAYIDRQGKATHALKYSWGLVTKDVFWTVLLTILTAIVLIIVGAAFLGIGLLITYPLAMLLIAQLYRALTRRTADTEPVVVQPAQIPSDLPVIETV